MSECSYCKKPIYDSSNMTSCMDCVIRRFLSPFTKNAKNNNSKDSKNSKVVDCTTLPRKIDNLNNNLNKNQINNKKQHTNNLQCQK